MLLDSSIAFFINSVLLHRQYGLYSVKFYTT